MSGSEYLQEALGDVLAKALSAVAKERPLDPIKFMAEFLYRTRSEEQTAKTDEDVDSGHYEDQEAPTNESNASLYTLELSDR